MNIVWICVNDVWLMWLCHVPTTFRCCPCQRFTSIERSTAKWSLGQSFSWSLWTSWNISGNINGAMWDVRSESCFAARHIVPCFCDCGALWHFLLVMRFDVVLTNREIASQRQWLPVIKKTQYSHWKLEATVIVHAGELTRIKVQSTDIDSSCETTFRDLNTNTYMHTHRETQRTNGRHARRFTTFK